MMHRALGAALAAVFLFMLVGLPQPAHAEPDIAKLVGLMLEAGEAERLADLVGEPELQDELIDDPQVVVKCCSLLETHARAITRKKGGEEHAAALIRHFETMADRAVRKHAKSGDVHRAKAHVISAKARHRNVAHGARDVGSYQACADLCVKASELSSSKKNEFIADAIGYLSEACPYADAEVAGPMLERAIGMATAALKTSPDDANLTAALGRTYMKKAEYALANKKKGDARKSLTEAAKILKPEGDLPKGKAGDRCAGAYNDVLFLGLANKIKIKGKVIQKDIPNREWFVHVPRGSGWEWGRGEDDGVFTVRKRYPNGWAVIRMRSYSWASLYTTPDGETGGDNMSGMMKQGQQLTLETLTDVKKRKKKIGGRLNKFVPKTTGYSLEGVDEDEDPVQVRAWYFKGKERLYTYGLHVFRYGRVPNDGQIDYILGTIKEKPKKK